MNKIKVKLIGESGNAFHVLSKVSTEMRRAGIEESTILKYLEEAKGGDYNHLLQVTMKYVDVE